MKTLSLEFMERFRAKNEERFKHNNECMEKPWSADVWFAAMVGEFGEAINAAKKIERVKMGWGTATRSDMPALVKAYLNELADVYVYFDLLCIKVGLSAKGLFSPWRVPRTSHLMSLIADKYNGNHMTFLCTALHSIREAYLSLDDFPGVDDGKTSRDIIALSAQEIIAVLLAGCNWYDHDFEQVLTDKFNEVSRRMGVDIFL